MVALFVFHAQLLLREVNGKSETLPDCETVTWREQGMASSVVPLLSPLENSVKFFKTDRAILGLTFW